MSELLVIEMTVIKFLVFSYIGLAASRPQTLDSGFPPASTLGPIFPPIGASPGVPLTGVSSGIQPIGDSQQLFPDQSQLNLLGVSPGNQMQFNNPSTPLGLFLFPSSTIIPPFKRSIEDSSIIQPSNGNQNPLIDLIHHNNPTLPPIAKRSHQESEVSTEAPQKETDIESVKSAESTETSQEEKEVQKRQTSLESSISEEKRNHKHHMHSSSTVGPTQNLPQNPLQNAPSAAKNSQSIRK